MSVPDTVLSIILTSRNQLGALKLSLLSLLDQPPEVNFEIIVVDCGSTDGTGQFLTGQAEKGTIRAIFSGEEKGRTVARNLGAHAAFGRHLMFVDPGLLVAPHWWESLLRSLEKDPRLAAIAGRILLPDGTLDHAGLALLQWSATETAGPRLSTRSIHAGRPGNHPPAERPMMVQALAGEAVMVRATSFFAVGGFSARVGRQHILHRPDHEGDPAGVDLCLRLGHRGWSCVYQPESIMTRLRNGGQDAEYPFADHEGDMAVLGRAWQDRVRPDFLVQESRGTVPAERGAIKPYVEPTINFQTTRARGTVDPDGQRNKPEASVIIPTMADLAATRRCVTALLENTDPCHELILLDSGTDLEMKQYLGEVARRHSHCQVVVGGDETTEVQMTNQAFGMCQGRYVVMLDRQVVVTTGWLETLMATAEMNPQAGLVGPVTNRMNGMQQVPAVDYDVETLDGLKQFASRQKMKHVGNQNKTTRLGGFCLLIKRELLARIGGLDSRFDGGFYEFNDYSMRAHMAGYDCLIARGCYVHHQIADPSAIITQERMMHLEIQWEIFKRKWNVPASIGLNSKLDLSTLLVGGFDQTRHFHPLGTGSKMEPSSEGMVAQALNQKAANS